MLGAGVMSFVEQEARATSVAGNGERILFHDEKA
jgi:hypothetical protein